MLSQKQLETIANVIKKTDNVSPDSISEWCLNKMGSPSKQQNKFRSGRRKHSRQYYSDIINFLQNKNIEYS